MNSPPGSEPVCPIIAYSAYPLAKACTPVRRPVPQKIQPMGFSGRREAINAPTVGNANDSTLKSTVKAGGVSVVGIGEARK
jgi:hypothetical protein